MCRLENRPGRGSGRSCERNRTGAREQPGPPGRSFATSPVRGGEAGVTTRIYKTICAFTLLAGILHAKSNALTLSLKLKVSVISGFTSIFPLPISASARG